MASPPSTLLTNDLLHIRTEAAVAADDATSLTLRRPGFLPGSWYDEELTRAIRCLFPAAVPRPQFGGWNGRCCGFTAGLYMAALYNMEGSLVRADRLESSMIRAGLVLGLHDLLEDEKIWVAGLYHYSQNAQLTLGVDTATHGQRARFLVIPCRIVDPSDRPSRAADKDTEAHWVLAIADKRRNTIFWYNSLGTYQMHNTQRTLSHFLARAGLTETALGHVTVHVTDQPSTWECGLFVVECARVFFREQVLSGSATHVDWSRSRLCVYWARAQSVARPTTGQKSQWVRHTWIAWIRAELGQLDLCPLRQPDVPLEPYTTLATSSFQSPIPANNPANGSINFATTMPTTEGTETVQMSPEEMTRGIKTFMRNKA